MPPVKTCGLSGASPHQKSDEDEDDDEYEDD
jgi:hypothetical protein